MRTIFDIMKTLADVKVGDTIVSLSGGTDTADAGQVEGMKSMNSSDLRRYCLLTLSEAKELGWKEDIPDKSPVACWDCDDVRDAFRPIRFFDAVNGKTFSLGGSRNSSYYDNYELLPLETAYIIFGGKDKYEEILNQLED